MEIELSSQQLAARDKFREFAQNEIEPFADQHDRDENTPPELIGKMAEAGYLGAVVPREYGGLEMDAITFGLLCEEIGRSSTSILSLLTVQGMVCQAIAQWGSPEQRMHWLPKLATGQTIAAFGLTEPDVGSDAGSVETAAVEADGHYVLNGKKQWISFGQVADLFLIIAQCNGKATAFLVERDSPGFSSNAITGMLGFRAAMLAKLSMDECRIPAANLVGRIGFGFSHVAGVALDHGRYCVGWGCLGLAEACLHASLEYANQRKQFGSLLRGHQLIQQMLAEMIANIKATRLLCYHAGYLKDRGDPALIMETSTAKYFASKTVSQAAGHTLQIHGANGCSSAYPVQRYLRDAKIMEIIEGSTQIQQIIIAKSGLLEFSMEKRRRRKQAAGNA
ncbi:MAG: acyl-CoA dehydrogenase family protein [Candidatus Latescibacterota bacterium]|nr:acyl-CoA dehydrogenase family protein [Candidatus Latescibacterota bacterium]